MAVNRGAWVRQNGGVGTTPKEARLVMAGLVAENSPGNPRNGLLFQSVPNVVQGTGSMSYNVLANNPVINRVANEGVYMPTFTGSTTVATTSAPGSGFRYDLIWVKQNDTEKLDADNLAVLGVTQGVASPTPVKPTADIPAGALVLAEALVGATATSTNSAQVTITQVWRHTATRGAPIPVRDATELSEITAYEGLQVARLDKGGRVQTYMDGVWGVTQYLVSLTGGWVNQAGTVPARVEVEGGMASFNALVRRDSGSSTTLGTVPDGARPLKDVSFTVLGQNASNAAGPAFRVYVAASTGLVTVNAYTGIGGSWTAGATGTWFPISATWAVA